MNTGLLSTDIRIIQETLSRFESIHAAILFGSRAKGTYRTGSDVDIALKGEINMTIVAHVSSILNEETRLPYQFDILDYQTIQSVELKEHIDRVGFVLYHK